MSASSVVIVRVVSCAVVYQFIAGDESHEFTIRRDLPWPFSRKS